jgi:hypothetical protein
VMMTMPQSDADCFFSLSRIRRRRIKTLDSQLRTCQMGSMGRSRCDNSRSLHCLPLSVAGCALFGDCPNNTRGVCFSATKSETDRMPKLLSHTMLLYLGNMANSYRSAFLLYTCRNCIFKGKKNIMFISCTDN